MIKKNQSMIYLEMYLYKAKKLIIKKDCTFEDLDVATVYLNECRNIASEKEARIDVWFGKLELKRSRMSKNSLDRKLSLSNAKNSFFMSLSKCNNPSAHYGLFKVAVEEEDWVSAKEHLTEYERSDRKKHYNFALVHGILDTCMGIKCNYQLKRSEYVFSNHITYPALLKNYRLAEEAFCAGRYNICLKHLLVCQKLAIIKGITIDFSSVISMAAKMIKMRNNRVITELKSKIFNTTSIGDKIVLIRKILNVSPSEVELYFMLIDCYIELGVYGCIPEILAEIREQDMTEIDAKRVSYYETLAYTREQYEEKLVMGIRCLQAGEHSLANGDFVKAYNCFVNGWENSNKPVFLSRLGDLFYDNGYYRQAEQYYMKYLNTVCDARLGADIYVCLYRTYRYLNDDDKAYSIAKISFNCLNLVDKGYTLESWCNYLEAEYNNELSNGDSASAKVKVLPSLLEQLV